MTALKQVLALFEQLDGDDNDLGPFGMDVMQRKRLKVGKLMQKKKIKPRKPMRSKMPYSMANIPKLPKGESRLRGRGYLSEATVRAKKGTFKIKAQDPNKPYVPMAKGQTVDKEVKGYILGSVGLDSRGWYWGVTHIPTGLFAGRGTFKKLSMAKLYAEMANVLFPKTDDVNKAREVAHRHFDEFGEYAAYLEGDGKERYLDWRKAK